MAVPGWALGWLGLTATLVIGQILVCEVADEDHPDTSGNIFETILGLVTGTFCAGLPVLVQLILFLIITVPGVLLLYGLVEPLFSGSIGGLVAGGVALLLIGGFFVGVL